MIKRDVALSINLGAAAVFVIALLFLIARYWEYHGVGSSGGNGLALMIIVAPIAFMVFVGVALGIRKYTTRIGTRDRSAILVGVLGLSVTFVVLFLLEVWRLADYPSERPKNLSAFISESFRSN